MRCFKWSPGTVNSFLALDHPKMRLGKVEKAMFQGLALHFEFIFSLLTSRKCILGEVEKAVSQVV